MNAVPALLEAITVLSYIGGHFANCGEKEMADRCDAAATSLRLFMLDMLEEAEAEEAEDT